MDQLPRQASKSDPVSARDWPRWRKLCTVAFVAVGAFLSTFGSSIIAPGRQQIQDQFHLSIVASVLPFSLFNFGLSFGSLVGSPASETLGRRPVYLVSLPLLLVFTLGCGFSQSLGSLLVCRFFAGLAASPALTIASAVIADLFSPDQRGIFMFCYYSMPWVGSVFGPLVGFCVLSIHDWPWTQWVFLLIAGPMILPGLLVLQESYDDRIFAVKAKAEGSRMQRFQKSVRSFPRSAMEYIGKHITRPAVMLCIEPIVCFTCIYAGFNFGLIYGLVIYSPEVFSDTYHFDYVGLGLSFLGLIIGCMLGPALLIADIKFLQAKGWASGLTWLLPPKPSTDTDKEVSASDSDDTLVDEGPPPERRLRGALFGGIIMPLGLIWFAWTAQPQIHWICPIIAQVLVSCGALMVYVSASTYVVDTYGPKYGASANAASTISRYLLAGAVPLFILLIYEALGVGWTTSILALCALILAPIPFVFFRFGPALRACCKFQRTL